jgi:methionyl-tRNA formyltransferase
MPPRIVFMGTPDFAVQPLRACFEVGEVLAVVTQPDKPKGRGQQIAVSPVARLAQERGIRVLQPAKIREAAFLEQMRGIAPDVCVVAAYGKLLPADLLQISRLGCVNVHASLLPRFRGAAPIQWAIAAGDAKTGVCLMKMDAGLDTGDVLACLEVPIRSDETAASLEGILSQRAGALVRQFLPLYVRGDLTPKPQPTEGVVLAPMLKKEDARLDFGKSAPELERRIRAFDPWPGSFTTLDGQRVIVHRARVGSGQGAPGTVLSIGPEGIEVACGQGSLVLLELQPEGKRRMSAPEFLAGRKMAVGARPFGP